MESETYGWSSTPEGIIPLYPVNLIFIHSAFRIHDDAHPVDRLMAPVENIQRQA
jgi:hypothetical protein